MVVSSSEVVALGAVVADGVVVRREEALGGVAAQDHPVAVREEALGGVAAQDHPEDRRLNAWTAFDPREHQPKFRERALELRLNMIKGVVSHRLIEISTV